MTFRQRARWLLGLLLRLVYLSGCILCVGLLVWVIRRQHLAEAQDADHVFMLLLPLTAPIGWFGAVFFELIGYPLDFALGEQFFKSHPALGNARVLLEAIFMSGLGYWQWFWLVPRLWLRLKWGRNWRRHLPHVEEHQDEELDLDTDEPKDTRTEKTVLK
jgi:cellulose synthase/poly-beta-1,6-N-acetylglucosamine synthase-like glycosyltransferase